MKEMIERIVESWRHRAKNLKEVWGVCADGSMATNSLAMTRALVMEDCADQLERLYKTKLKEKK